MRILLLLQCTVVAVAVLTAGRAKARPVPGPSGGPVRIEGTTTYSGLPARFELTVDGERFRFSVEGAVGKTVGFDGDEVWEVDGSSPGYPLVLLHGERALATYWIWSGAWSRAGSPLVVERGTNTWLTLAGGKLRAELAIDGETGRPSEVDFPDEFGGGQLTFDDWRTGELGTYPWAITWTEPGARPVVYATQSITRVDRASQALFAAPEGPGADTSFDADADAHVTVRRAGRGHLFVRPRIDGKEVGWFLFDSGAGGTIITQAAADELGLDAYGEVAVGGMGGPPELRPLRPCETMELGPLTIRGLAMSESADMGMADDMLGEPCAGALGWDVFLRAVVEIDPGKAGKPSVALFDPRGYSRTDDGDCRWEAVTLHWKVPYIRARFAGGREGLFCLDTGAGTTGVLFHALAGRELGLLADETGEKLAGRGAGGTFEMRQIDLEWFEVAGRRVSPARALVSVGDDGEADPYALGFLGSGFLGTARLVFDYSRRRLGFVSD